MGEEESGKSGSSELKSSLLYIVDFSAEFTYYYDKVFTNTKLDLIDDFIDHYELNGLKGWKGRIAKSSNVPNQYPDALSRIDLAMKYNLYHAHIGLPEWKTRPGFPYSTSSEVLHFQKVSHKEIKLLTVSTHNPMDLPTIENILN